MAQPERRSAAINKAKKTNMPSNRTAFKSVVVERWQDRFLFPAILVCILILAIIAPVVETLGSTMPAAQFGRRFAYPALAVMVLIFLPRPRLNRINPFPLVIALPLTWYGFSLTWSAVPDISAVRLVVTILSTWLMFVCVMRIRGEQAIDIVRYVLAAALTVNYAFVVFYPNMGLMDVDTHNWRGIMSDKNNAGMLCGMTCIFWLLHVPLRLRIIGYFVSAFAIIFLIMTWSRTAMFMTILSIAIYPLILLANRREMTAKIGKEQLLLVKIITSSIVMLVILYLTFFSDYLSRIVSDAEILSKRGTIWQPMVQTYLEHPVGGVGFGSYWGIGSNDQKTFSGTWLYRVYQGHNGFLDIALQTGLVGLFLAIIATIVWPATKIISLLPASPYRLSLISSVLLFCIGSNFTESGLFDKDKLWHVFMMFGIASIWRINKHSLSSGTKIIHRS